MIHKKTAQEIAIMREGGKKLAELLQSLARMVRLGASTVDLDKEAERRIRLIGGIPAFKGYRAFGAKEAFPGCICTSINEEIVHGLPYPERIFQEGDVVSIDIGMKYKGFFLDTALTVGVAPLNEEKKRLIQTAEKALQTAIKNIDDKLRAGLNPTTGPLTTNDIGSVVQDYVEANGFNIVKELVGHGVGKSLHEDPNVPNFHHAGTKLEPGTVIAIEPMIYIGDPGVSVEEGGWRIYTENGGVAAHFEHTVAILEDHVEILTS